MLSEHGQGEDQLFLEIRKKIVGSIHGLIWPADRHSVGAHDIESFGLIKQSQDGGVILSTLAHDAERRHHESELMRV